MLLGVASAYFGLENTRTLTRINGTVTTVGARDQITIGATNFQSDEYFNGDLAQVRAWNSTLSDAEIVTEFLSPTMVRTSNVVGWWELSSAATATVDSSGNGNTLGVSGFGSLSTAPSGPIIGF